MDTTQIEAFKDEFQKKFKGTRLKAIMTIIETVETPPSVNFHESRINFSIVDKLFLAKVYEREACHAADHQIKQTTVPFKME